MTGGGGLVTAKKAKARKKPVAKSRMACMNGCIMKRNGMDVASFRVHVLCFLFGSDVRAMSTAMNDLDSARSHLRLPEAILSYGNDHVSGKSTNYHNCKNLENKSLPYHHSPKIVQVSSFFQ